MPCVSSMAADAVAQSFLFFFFFQAEDGIRDDLVTGVQTCALPIYSRKENRRHHVGLWPDSADLGAAASRLLSGYTCRAVNVVAKADPNRTNRRAAFRAINTFAATCPAPTLLLPGIIRRRCFCLVQESFLIFLVVAPKKDGQNDRCNKHRPSKWSSDSTNTFSKHVSADSEHCRPDNSPCRIEDEEPQRGQSVCSGQQCRKGAQQSDETSEEDDLPAVASK